MSACPAVLADQHREIACELSKYHDGEHKVSEWWHDTPHRARVAVTTSWGSWRPDPEAAK